MGRWLKLTICFYIYSAICCSGWSMWRKFSFMQMFSCKGKSIEIAFLEKKWSDVAQSCPTLCDPVDCSLQGSSVHGIFQARVLEWVAISFSRGSSRPRDQTQVFCIAGRHFTVWATECCNVGSETISMNPNSITFKIFFFFFT